MREGSRRGSALIPQGAARHSPGWLRQRGTREAGWAGGERASEREREGEQGGELGNSAQPWPSDATTTGTLIIGREAEGKYGLGSKGDLEEAPEVRTAKQNEGCYNSTSDRVVTSPGAETGLYLLLNS